MSPEQARGDKIVDQRSDVYALGAILYELCSGRKPHPGESHNAILHHIATQPAVPLESVVPELPVDFLAIVAGALAADPAARPPSAGALVEALAPFAKREIWPAPKLDESGASRPSSTPPSPSAEARGSRGGAASASGARRTSRRSRLGPVVAVSAVAIVAALVAMGVGRRKETALSPEAAAPAAKPSLASTEQPSLAARPALIANVAPALNASPPVHPLAGADGSAVAHPTRRHAARPAPNSAAPSAAPPAPATKPPVPPVTFDPQNPYE
jgi:serine/threonine-protein kinase